MAVNEAPRLTIRVVALLMVAVFFLCFVADQFQCSKNGRQTFCTGRPPYHCVNDWCREEVRDLTADTSRHRCKFRGTSDVVFAYVEVGPSLVSERGLNISDYMVDEVRELINTGEFPRTSITTGGQENRRVVDHYVLDNYNDLSWSLRRLLNEPANITQFTVVNDVIPLPAYQQGEPQRFLDFNEAIEAVLPTSRLDDATQLERHFPRLHRALNEAVKRRKENTAGSAKCDSIHVVVFILVSPLASVRDVWGSNQGFRGILTGGNSLVAGAVTRYISTDKRLLKYLNGVQFVYLHIPMPTRQFSPSLIANRDKTGPVYTNYAYDAVQVPVTGVHASVAFCNVSHDESRASACLQTCGRYDKFSFLAAKIDGDRASYRYSDAAFSTRYATSTVFHNCYFEVLWNTGAVQENGTFSLAAEADMFDDCFHLSPTGGRAFASCLLRMRATTDMTRFSHFPVFAK